MIEINLLPGARKPKRSAGPSVDVGAMFSGAMARVTDPFLIIALVGVVLGLGAVAVQYVLLGRSASAVTERQTQATADSTRFAVVLAERSLAEAQRDSIGRQFSFIHAVDGARFTWAHLLSELNTALPAYTWLIRITQTSPVISVVSRDTMAGKVVDTSSAAAKRPKRTKTIEELEASAAAAVPRLSIRVIGQTVDVGAVTRLWRTLEASPFIEGVSLVGTDIKLADGREVTEFTLDMTYQIPAPSAIRTVPLKVAVR
jgi:Tfp pilus assembly protein PilN